MHKNIIKNSYGTFEVILCDVGKSIIKNKLIAVNIGGPSKRPYAKIYKNNTSVYLHRYLLDVESKVFIDHINGNSLDNRIENLRIATRQQNAANRGPFKNKAVKFKGVTITSCKKRFSARIRINDNLFELGRFKTEGEAAVAYDIAAEIAFKKYAFLNHKNFEIIVPSEFNVESVKKQVLKKLHMFDNGLTQDVLESWKKQINMMFKGYSK